MDDQANLLPVKIQYHEENRRFRFNALNTLAAFRQQAYSLFRIPAEIQTVLFYWDGEDWIVVEQEDEWVETKRLMLLGAGVAKPEMVFKLKLQDRMPADWTKNAQNALFKIETVVKEAAEKIVKAEVVQRVVASVQREIEQEDSQVRRHVDQIIEDVKDGLKFIVDDLNASLGSAGAASAAAAAASAAQASPAVVEEQQPAAAETQPAVVEQPAQPAAPAAAVAIAQIPKGLAESWSFVEIQQENQLAEQPIVAAPAVVPAVAAAPSPVPIHPVPVKSPSPVVFMDTTPSVVVAEHVTMPHGAEAVVGQTFVKTWKLHNNGQVQWPQGTMMAYVSGPAPQIIQLKFLTRLPQLSPGETSDVSVEMTAPAAPGQYRGAFRLADRHGQCFGDAFDFVINVIHVSAPVPAVPAVPEVPAVPIVPHVLPVSAPLPPVEVPVPSKWQLQLEQLHAMGFCEDDKNVQVLERCNGDIQLAVLNLIGA